MAIQIILQFSLVLYVFVAQLWAGLSRAPREMTGLLKTTSADITTYTVKLT